MAFQGSAETILYFYVDWLTIIAIMDRALTFEQLEWTSLEEN